MSASAKRPLIDLLAAHCREAGLASDRDALLAAILCGDVRVGGERCREAKRPFAVDAPVELAAGSPIRAARPADAAAALPPGPPFVSRGGDKLDCVLQAWAVPVAGRVWLDAGCSTGGFTHCLLARGAALVHAVDVGYNVLDWRLRRLDRVRLRERCNVMGLEALDPPPEAAVADLSFRSMQGAARKILSLVAANRLYALVKPQFERKYRRDFDADAAEDFKGVVGSAELRAILADVAARLAGDGVALLRLAPAGVKGRSGNQEYLAELALAGPADATGGEAAAEALAAANRQVVAAHFRRA